ncbi:MAG TPA: TadE family protein [Candidatus Baltobacteraceae bacterium]|nr:TadE family protein [Candidatus Baltobacteraceae bacterium]
MRSVETQRGQALIESVIFIPFFLLVLFGLMWIVSVSVINERAQIAVRYSGLISNEASPYSDYSLYAVYNNVGQYSQGVPTICVTPGPDAFLNDPSNGAFPGPTAAPFWAPDNNQSSGNCTPGPVVISGGQMPSPFLLLHSDATAQAQKTPPLYVQPAAGPLSMLSAEMNFVNTPDIGTLMTCYTDLHDDASATLVGETQSNGQNGFTAPLPDSNPTNSLSISNNCSGN